MKRFLSFVFLSFIFISSMAAKTWFVCAGSFSKFSLAKERCELLSEKGHKVFIDETLNSNGDKIYRVLFYDPMMLRDDARNRKTELMFSKSIQETGINDLWICEADLPKENAPEVFEAKEIIEPEVFQEVVVEPEPQVTVEMEPQIMEEPEREPVAEPEPQEEQVVEPEPVVKKVAPVRQMQAVPEIPEEPVVLETNEEVELSEETPYSVFVRSYREEEKANNDRDRMLEQDLNAYVLKKFDEESFIKFDLHAGTFETYKEAEDYQEVLEENGIYDTKVSDYEDFAEELERYDEVVTEEDVTLNFGSLEMPEDISENVVANISQFPINRDFEIVKISILDLKNIRNSTEDLSELTKRIPMEEFKNEFIDSVSYAKYRDNLFNKELEVYIIQAEEQIPGVEDLYDYKDAYTKKKDFMINYGVLHSMIEEKYGDGIFLFGYTEDRKMALAMNAANFSMAEFENFMNCSYSDSSLLIYPQIRRTFYVLPQNPSVKRDFIAYNLGQVEETYAIDRGYVDWSLPMVGTWEAASYFDQDGELASVSFFDLGYDYNATRVHGMFMGEKQSNDISDSNRPVDVNGLDGWYMENIRGNELSFSHKSYIISVDNIFDSKLYLPELFELATDLNIW